MGWNDLSMAEKAEVMRLAVEGGVYDLDSIRNGYNEFAKGGRIHIKPSKRGTFTAAASKHGMGVQQFASRVLAHPENYSPAMRKKANFARNASKWKHGEGGELDVYDKPQTFAGRVVEAAGVSPSIVRGADVASSIAQITPWGHYIAATDLGRDLNRVYHKEKGAKKDVLLDLVSMLPGISAPELKAAENAWNTIRGNSKIRKALNIGIISGRVADFIDDTYGANKTSKAYGGELGNYYDGWGNFINSLKAGSRKIKQKVNDWGLAKSPGQHIYESIASHANSDRQYRQNLYNTIDPTSDVPSGMGIVGYGLSALASKFGKEAPYTRVRTDSVADAAWAKRLELPYNTSAIIDNGDGTFRLPASNEAEMPVDTTFLKNRITDNQKLLNQVHGFKHRIVQEAIDADTRALNSLRKTYATGEPVEMDEHSYVNRNWQVNSLKDMETSPLNVLHRYTMQYDKDSNKMKYWDWYDFNEFEKFVPGKPFKIQGSIDLNKKE